MAKGVGRVCLVGAGPGAVDLITLRAAELLGAAEVVVYDSQVNEELLQWAPPSAELIDAGEAGASAPALGQEELHRLLVESARAGKLVVRLMGDDPLLFGGGAEEGTALVAAGVDFEIVPGLTALSAAPAFAGIPLTDPEHGCFVAFVGGRHDARKPAAEVPWAELIVALRGRGTLMLSIAAARMGEELERLIALGMPSDTPAAAIQHATLASQRTEVATLGSLAAEAARAQVGGQAVVVVGECARARERLRWFERRPLFGRRIVVTRAKAAAAALARPLRALGAEVLEFPTIRTLPPDSYAALDAALARLGAFDWVLFTSATGVDAFVARLGALGRDIRELGNARLGAIGPATAARLGRYGLTVAAEPAEFRAEALAEALGEERIRGARVLIPRAQVAREALPEILAARGARVVEVVPAYKTVPTEGKSAARMRRLLAARALDLVTFTSSSTVSNFCAIVGPPPAGFPAGAIGPITAETARGLGFNVVVSPSEYTVAALVQAIADHFAGIR